MNFILIFGIILASFFFTTVSESSELDSVSLPDPLTTQEGEKVTTVEQWQKIRRPEILELFKVNIYGRAPVGRPENFRLETKNINPKAMGGKATLKLVDIHFSGPGGEGLIKLELFIPNKVIKPVSGFLLIRNRPRGSSESTEEIIKPFSSAEQIIDRGYMAASLYTSDLDPDYFDEFENGVHGIFDPKGVQRSLDAWGTMSAWAWGASRVMDYFETDEDIDEKRIGVIGHSRNGKAALWCGALDERFSLTISNNSGCSGAALARNKKGERVKRITTVFPHWFCENYKKFQDNEDSLPVDQHELIALMAPRLVYVASASKDKGADPEGEFLSCVHADPVYRLFGLQGIKSTEMPGVGEALHDGHIGHHIRDGKHALTEYDWNHYMDFADKHWKKK